MFYRIREIKIDIFDEKSMLLKKIKKRIGINGIEIFDYKIVKESIDARDKNNIKLVYTIDFKCNKKLNLPIADKFEYQYPKEILDKDKRPVIVGFGPCGMFCGLILADMGYRPIIVERGKPVEDRTKDVIKFWEEGKLDENSNVQFGEGGAGTFSDGKLTTGIKDARIKKILEEMVNAGANSEILYKQKPHIGTDALKGIVSNIRKKIIELGGEIRFSSKMIDIETNGNQISGVKIEENNKVYTLQCDKLVIAIGHSARDTLRNLYDVKLSMKQKPFSMGVRIQHSQKMIDEAQYGDSKKAERLGAAEYKLNCKTKNGRGVYTFCMCPGGEIVMASSAEGQVVTNGMSYSSRDGKYANSGLLVDVRVEDFHSEKELAGIDFQEKYEKKAYEIHNGYVFPETTWKDFKNSELIKCLPDFVAESIIEAIPKMGRKLRGFDSPDAIIKGVETRSSSPVRIDRDKKLEGSIGGIYPAGEGAGYAGGIISAAVDGIKVAEKIVESV